MTVQASSQPEPTPLKQQEPVRWRLEPTRQKQVQSPLEAMDPRPPHEAVHDAEVYR